jgi:hypothetical protein
LGVGKEVGVAWVMVVLLEGDEHLMILRRERMTRSIQREMEDMTLRSGGKQL